MRQIVASHARRLWSRVRALAVVSRRSHPPENCFYPSVESCQIPNLSFVYSRFLGHSTNGTFVEVGAFDGVFASNSWGLAKRGWRGVMLEPQLGHWKTCAENYRNFPKVSVERTAVGAPGIESLELVTAGALTTANQDLAEEYRVTSWSRHHVTTQTESVPCTTLDEILERHGLAPGFEVLIVDVEGFEAEVLAGFDVRRWHPQMMVWELADMHPDLIATAASDAQVLLELQDAGYQVVYKDHINTVFVDRNIWLSTTGVDA